MPSPQNSPMEASQCSCLGPIVWQTSYHPDLTFFSPPLLAGRLLRQEIMLAMPLLPQSSNNPQAHTKARRYSKPAEQGTPALTLPSLIAYNLLCLCVPAVTQAQDSSESHHGATQKPEDRRLREKQGYHLLTCFFKVLLRKPFLRLGQPGGLLGVGVTEGLRVMVVDVGLRRWAGSSPVQVLNLKESPTETVLGLRASWAFRQGLHRGSQRSWGSQRQGTAGAGASWPPQGWTDLKSDRQAAVRHTQEKWADSCARAPDAQSRQ